MSRRTRAVVDYAGAAGRMSIADVLALGPRWGVMPKADGWYVHCYLDRHGRIERLLTRTGETVPKAKLGDLVGCHVGAPDSVLAGELLDSGPYPVVALFDAIRVNGVYVAREPFRVRWDWLYRSQSFAENLGERRHYRVEGDYARHKFSGRYCQAIPRTWERTPILPLVAPAKAGDLWEQAIAGEAEGVVAVRLDARIGARRSKVKVKPVMDLSAVVLSADPSGYVLRILGSETIFATGRCGFDLVPGDVAEVEHENWYAGGVPRFARVVRRRMDLMHGGS